MGNTQTISNTKRGFAKKLMIAVVAFALMTALAVFASAEVIETGICGDDATWILYDDGTLEISGTGEVTYCKAHPIDHDPNKDPNGYYYDWLNYYGRSVTRIVVNPGITSIGHGLSLFDNLTSVSIADSVESIGENAFYGCEQLTSITFGNGLTSIGDRAFCDCESLKSINLPDSLIDIGGFAFSSCESLESINIPANVTSIGIAAFEKCTSLISIDLPEGLTSIESSTFQNCLSLEAITMPNSVTTIGTTAFDGCESLKSINFSDRMTSIGLYAFSDCYSLSTVAIPIPNNVESIGAGAFYGCSSLSRFAVPQKVEEIKVYTFMGCKSLNEIIIPKSVKTIGERAFQGCNALRVVNYRGCVSEWNQIEIDQSESEYYDKASNQELLNATRIYNYGTHVHAYTSTVTTPATCTAKGVLTYTCTCGDSYTEDIPIHPNAHATLNENGDCPRCGKHIKDMERPSDAADEKPVEKPNFFQRIIQWFRDLFAKLFKR